MDFFFTIGNLMVGVFLLMIGIKIYNPFKGKNQAEKEELFYNKYGTFFKVVGVLLIIWNVFKMLT